MVQMKEILKMTGFHKSDPLYIPHGSDERRNCREGPCCKGRAFISHMVQMKGFGSSSLYVFFVTFISHMVQMKGERAKMLAEMLSALYPTWFR